MNKSNQWHRYSEDNLPPPGTFLAFVAEEPHLYVALRNLNWSLPHFWNGKEWTPITGIIAAWHSLLGAPSF
jgi:hypothetical protein